MSKTTSDVALPTAPPPDAQTTQYQASCHCGAFAYTIAQSPALTSPGAEVMDCNCSICSRNGYLFIYTPDERVEFTKGRLEDFRAYQFGSKKMAHYFCGTCGASCLARSVDPDFFPGMTCVNVRMLQGVDLKGLNLKFADGASYNPADV